MCFFLNCLRNEIIQKKPRVKFDKLSEAMRTAIKKLKKIILLNIINLKAKKAVRCCEYCSFLRNAMCYSTKYSPINLHKQQIEIHA
jgi:hypothetical protein